MTVEVWPDVVVRIRALDEATGAYGLEALTDGGPAVMGTLRLDEVALRAAALDADRYGTTLSEAVLAGEVGGVYREALRRAESRHRGRLRVRLLIDDEAAEVQAILWERLHHLHRGRSIPVAISGRTPFSRFTDTDFPLETLATRTVRVLFAVSNPVGLPPDLGPIGVDEEISAIHEAVGGLASTDRIKVTILPGRSGLAADLRGALVGDRYVVADGPTSLRNLARLMGEHDVVHVLSHGHFRRDSPTGAGVAALYLEREDGGWEAVQDDRLADTVAALDPFCPHLLFLSACESARQDPTHPLVGMAPKLVAAGVPAVVGMQAPVPVSLARDFTVEFYRGLLDQGLVDVALNRARLLLYDRAQVDWAIPVLFSRLRDGRIFVPGHLAGAVVNGRVVLRHTEHGVRADRRKVDPPTPSLPVRALPRDVPDVVDREDELATAIAVLQAGRSVQVHGEAGIGKSTLLRHLVHRAAGPDGVVHGSARGRSVEDLLQYLFDRVFRTEASYRPPPGALRDALAEVKVLFALDDVELSPEDLGRLMDGAPAAMFLLAGPRPSLAGEVQSIRLDGLSPPAAMVLFERNLGRSLEQAEMPEARVLVESLRGHPQHVIQAAARVRDEQVPLGDVLTEIAATDASPPGAKIGAVQLSSLAPVDRKVLGILAALGTAPLGPEHLEALTGERDLDEALERLQRRGLIRAGSPAFTLAQDLSPEAARVLGVEGWRERLLEHFLGWGSEHRGDTSRLLRSLEALLQVLDWAGDAGRAGDYLRIARIVEEPLLVARRWGTWGGVLRRSLRAAEEAGDLEAGGWAQHELGTRALGEARSRTARHHLRRARRLRKQAGDRPGLRLTRHNLRLVSVTPWYMAGATVLVAVAAAVFFLLPTGGVTASPSPVSFGEAPIEGDRSIETVTLRPSGDPVRITDIAIEPAFAEYTLQRHRRCLGTLRNECSVRIVFRPQTADTLHATLVIRHTGEDGLTEVPIDGTGVPPPGAPALRFDPPSVDFGAVPAQDLGTRTVRVINEGDATLVVRSVDLGPERGDAFEIAEDDCGSREVPVDQECTIEVRFLGTSSGPPQGELLVRSNAVGGPHTVPLSGRTALPDLEAVLAVGEVSYLERVPEGTDDVRPSRFARVPVIITVLNQGDVAAERFWVAITASGEPLVTAQFLERPEVLRLEDGVAVWVEELPSRAELVIRGFLEFRLPDESGGVDLVAEADACVRGATGTCHVPELNEENNRSSTVHVPLRVSEPEVGPTTPGSEPGPQVD